MIGRPLDRLSLRRISMRSWVAATVALAVLITTLVATFVAYRLEQQLTRTRFVNNSGSFAVAAAQQLEGLAARTGTAQLQHQAAATAKLRLVVTYVLYEHGEVADPSVCAAVTCLRLPTDVRAAVSADRQFSGWSTLGSARILFSVEPITGTDAALVTAFDYSPDADDLSALRRHLMWVIAAGVVVATAVGLAVGQAVSRPVRAAAAAARRLSHEDFTARLPARGGSELVMLSAEFNAMAQRLAHTLQDLRLAQTLQQRFVADVSHELRTPLAAMLASASALNAGDDTVRVEATLLLQNQVARMHHLVEDLLEISRFDAGQADMNLETVDAVDLCTDAVRAVAPDLPIPVIGTGDTDVAADARRVHAIVRNLLTNALTHGAPPVSITVSGTRDTVDIVVADHGPGVPPHLADAIFERFVHADISRTGTANSSGLGLAIATENARLHNATITLSRGAQTRFTLTLPRTPPPTTHEQQPDQEHVSDQPDGSTHARP